MTQTVFKLPDIGEGVVEGEIVAWHVQPGDVVQEDQPLVDVMTDKATVTIPSVVNGRVVSTTGKVGELVAVGSGLIVFELDGSQPTAASAAKSHEPAVAAVGASQPAAVATKTRPAVEPVKHVARATAPVHLTERPLASPAVRRRAREKGVNLKQVVGTGRGGRITDADVDAHLAPSPASSVNGRSRAKRHGIVEVPVAGLRRKIAEKMTISSQNIPHFTYIEEVDLTELQSLRTYMNNNRKEDEPKLTFLPFIMLALVKSLQKHPECNAHYDEERNVVMRYESIHLGMATQTERGLYVPVIRHVEAMDLYEAAHEIKRVSQSVHSNTAKREDLGGSTFTVSSLGALGGLAATPIINHPEVAILGIHKAEDRAVVRNGQIVIRHMVNFSASFDHRIIDGADGANLIQTLKGLLEHPATIFI